MPDSAPAPPKHVAIFDLGKTHAKVILADIENRREIAVRVKPNTVLSGPPYPHYDVDGLKEFLLSALAAFQEITQLDAIFVTTHGAACAIVDDKDLVLPVLDYEYSGPDEIDQVYSHMRPDEHITGSPRLPRGLNTGAQLYWLKGKYPDRYERAKTLLFWPQYWTWWLTGLVSSEISYATSHSDLFDLKTKKLVVGSVLDANLVPPLTFGGDALGVLRPELAARVGTYQDVCVYVGGHDSSLALEAARGTQSGPVTIVSTGTWVTVFALGIDEMPATIDERTMASCDMHSSLVPNFRFMGGQAYQDVLKSERASGETDWQPEDVDVVRASDGTKFTLTLKHDGTQVFLPNAPADVCEALISKVMAHLTCDGLKAINAKGPILISGPFANNDEFCKILAARTKTEIHKTEGATGVVNAVANLLNIPVKTHEYGEENDR